MAVMSRLPATKIQPPRLRSTRIARPALEAALRAALQQRRVVLLVAPAGFGKTAALVGALEQLGPGHVAGWVALDEDDDTPRLFEALAAALEPADLPWRTAPDALAAQVGDERDGTRRALAELVNALAGSDAPHGVLVLDDLHRVQSPQLLAFLDALLERLPPQWTLVLASRVEPPLALARWRVADELAEFGEAALRFSADEAAALVASEPAVAAGPGAAALIERTRGWPAGLRLCLAALRQRPALAAALSEHGRAPLVDRALFDYLAAEVLDDMPIGLHDFLLRCSVLPSLTATRAAAVSGDARSAVWLDEIERRGLFVSAVEDQERGAERTLVLHDLFRDALDDRLRRRLPDELPRLLQRAAASEPDPVRRVGYLLRARDWRAAEAVLAGLAPELLISGHGAELLRLAGQFPDDWRAASPRVLRLRALARVQRWEWDAAAADLRDAVRCARAHGDEEQQRIAQACLLTVLPELGRHDEEAAIAAELRGCDLPTEARLQFVIGECSRRFLAGDLAALPGLFAEVVERLEPIESLQTWWENAPPMSWSTLRGMRPLIERYCAGLLQRLGERELPLRALLHSQRAWVLLWGGQVDAALEAVARAEGDARWLAAAADVQANVRVLRLLVEAMQGHADAVRAGLEELLRGEQGSAERRRVWTYQVAIFGLRLTEVLGPDPDGLRRWTELMAAHAPERAPEGGGSPSLAPARLAAAQGRWEEAAQRFAAALPNAPRLDQMGQAVELHLRAAHALQRAGRRAEAAAALQPALERMSGEGELGHALMAGPAVLAELASADWSGALDAPGRATLAQAAALAARLRGAADVSAAVARPAACGAGDDLLSEREREVLERIAAGDSNKLIARALDISPHTVKRHVANILDKLALASRGQAAAWWRTQV